MVVHRVRRRASHRPGAAACSGCSRTAARGVHPARRPGRQDDRSCASSPSVGLHRSGSDDAPHELLRLAHGAHAVAKHGDLRALFLLELPQRAVALTTRHRGEPSIKIFPASEKLGATFRRGPGWRCSAGAAGLVGHVEAPCVVSAQPRFLSTRRRAVAGYVRGPSGPPRSGRRRLLLAALHAAEPLRGMAPRVGDDDAFAADARTHAPRPSHARAC